MEDVYFRLANHLKDLIMGYPFNDGLLDLLKKMFNPIEAQVALAIPNNLAPLEVVDLETIAVHSELSLSTVAESSIPFPAAACFTPRLRNLELRAMHYSR